MLKGDWTTRSILVNIILGLIVNVILVLVVNIIGEMYLIIKERILLL